MKKKLFIYLIFILAGSISSAETVSINLKESIYYKNSRGIWLPWVMYSNEKWSAKELKVNLNKLPSNSWLDIQIDGNWGCYLDDTLYGTYTDSTKIKSNALINAQSLTLYKKNGFDKIVNISILWEVDTALATIQYNESIAESGIIKREDDSLRISSSLLFSAQFLLIIIIGILIRYFPTLYAIYYSRSVFTKDSPFFRNKIKLSSLLSRGNFIIIVVLALSMCLPFIIYSDYENLAGMQNVGAFQLFTFLLFYQVALYLMVLIIGNILSIEDGVTSHILLYSRSHAWLSLIIIFSFFFPVYYIDSISIIVLVLVGLYILGIAFRIVVVTNKYLIRQRVPFLSIILYLCATEILPVLFLYREYF